MTMKTLILGATTNQDRYAYKAAERLTNGNHEIVPVGVRKGTVFGKEIVNDKTIQPDIHTVTLYVGAERQEEWKNYIFDTRPERVIFNPGTENPAFQEELIKKGVDVEVNCTLVMLSLGNF